LKSKYLNARGLEGIPYVGYPPPHQLKYPTRY